MTGSQIKKLLPAILWIAAVYGVTIVTASLNIAPSIPEHASTQDIRRAFIIFEGWHCAIHAFIFGVEAWLLARAAAPSDHRSYARTAGWLFLLIVGLGIGQEAIQSLIRARFHLGSAAFDLAADATGAAVVLGLLRWLSRTRVSGLRV